MVQHREATFSYDPMIYDVMRESANYLKGTYSHLADLAEDPKIKAALMETVWQIGREVEEVNASDMQAVESKSREFTQRLQYISNAGKKLKRAAA
ncbi:MAG: hypothetical protein ABF747_08360 [Bifidobacterium sp.]|uniref:Uncharacterized protein n=1 Tax=Bifidobacterium fermentum TaxID=3059035 RepID=A0AB39UB13_9BIFI